MTEPCHCDLASENAKLRGEVDRLRAALEWNRQGMRSILAFRKLYGVDRYSNLTREEVEGVIAEIDAALNPAPEVKP